MNHPVTGIIVTLFTLFMLLHCNLLSGYIERKSIYVNYSSNPKINYITNQVVKLGYQFGLGTRWRMYTPSQKYSAWIDWYMVTEDGIETKLLVPNLSPEYRNRRSILNMLFLDFKLALLNFSMLFNPENVYRERYAKILCGKLLANGLSVLGIRAKKTTITTPTISERPKDWNHETATPDSIENLGFYSCKI